MANVSPKYKKNAAGYTKHLKHKDVEKRRKAAKMVGELGVADAIPDLIWMMDKDPDEEVRKNARYSLGMFAAFRDATESDNPAKREAAAEALIGVMSDLNVGQPANPSAGTLRGVLIGLLVLFVVLVGGNAFVLFGLNNGQLPAIIAGGGGGGTSVGGGEAGGNADAPSQDMVTLAEAAQNRLNLLLSNADGIEAKMQPVLEGNQPGAGECPFPYTPAEPLVINQQDASQFPALATAYETLNSTLMTFDEANARAEDACRAVTPLTEAEATAYLDAVTALRDAAPALEADLTQLTTPPTATPPPADTATPAPDPTATPDYQSQISTLYNIIDEVQGARGANTLLEQYWSEAQANNGVTNGCRTLPPDIPANYDGLLPEDLEVAPVELQTAINNVNDGLQTLRDGWASFREACEGGENAVLVASGPGQTVSQTVDALFSSADQSLQALRGVNTAPDAGG